jgi:methanogenic corrinoid protein MtbC1
VPAKYTIKEVEERTGVAAATLRQWERRYRLPRPQRSSGGYRLYSDEDLDSIREMQDFIAKGVPPSRAAELVQQAAESVRRTAGEHRGGRSVAELADELALALRSLDMARAERVLSEGHALHPLEDVLLAVIAPAMVDIGEWWHAGEISVATEHLASQFVQGRLRQLLTLMSRIHSARRVLVACAPDELHELGALIVAIMLSRQGYDVSYLGQATPVQDLVALVAEVGADAVFISATMPAAVERLRQEAGSLRSLRVPIVVGGRAFENDAEALEELGGVFVGNDLRLALDAITSLVGRAA